MELQRPKSVDMSNMPPTVGDILICGGCGSINVVGLVSCHRLTDEEYNAMSKDEQSDLDFGVRAVKQNLRTQ